MENLKLLSKIALSFHEVENFDKDINEIFKKIGKHIGLSKINMFTYKEDNTLNKTFEWTSKETSSKIKLALNYPLAIGKNIYGFISFNDYKSERRWKEEELEIFKTLSKAISNAYECRSIQEKMHDFKKLTKEVEDKLQKLTNVVDGAKLGTWEWNIKTGKVQVNKNFAHMIGYSLEELADCDIGFFNKLISPKDLEKSKMILKKHLEGEIEYYDFEVKMKHKSGKWVWIHERGQVSQRDGKGQPIKMFGIYADINSRKKSEIELKESEERFLLALNETKAGLWDIDMKTGEVYFTPMMKKILGYEDHEMGNSFTELQAGTSQKDREKIKKAVNNYLNGKTKNYEVKHRLKHKDGKFRWILARGGILRDENDSPKRWLGTNIDITKEHEQALELERFFSVNLDLLCIIDTQGSFIKINTAWEALLGYSSKEIEGTKFDKFIHPEDVEKTLETFEKLLKDGKVETFVNRYSCSNGEYNYIEWKANLYEDVVYAAARNVTDRIKYEEKILEISNRDALTNIYNRRYIYERANEIIEEYRRDKIDFSVSILDIDKFKNINDSYGHQIGDNVLKEFTEKIQSKLRPYDLLGRYGGEEFIIILKNTEIETSNLIIGRILELIRETNFRFDNVDINFTFSAGISNSNEFEKDTMLIDDLVKLADERMYKAKNKGRNRIVID